MKIVLIITGLNTGGAEMMLLKLLERIDRHRFEPYVISLSGEGEIGPRIRALGITVEALGMRPGRPSPFAFISLVRRLRALRPDAVHTWMYHADLLGGIAARMARIKAVGWGIHHNNLSPQLNKRSTLMVVTVCAWLSGLLPVRIQCCSESSRQVHARFGYDLDKLSVIPNGFDLSHFYPNAVAREVIRTELALPSHTLLVGLIGRYDPQKNHAGFFQAAARLHAKMPGVHFVLAGKGIDEHNIEMMEQIKRAGVVSVIHLLSIRKDIPRLMAALDVLASSSDGEAFPNVLGEAMACGVPCVVTDVGDSASIVGDTGRVVAPGDMAGLAAEIEELLMLSVEARHALGEKARARVAEHFHIEQVVRRYESFYVELAKQGEKRSCAV
ncbi:glycosyltransferase family 4 protein [Crenobacter cavernae]|nr:glycosyltransferase [Crenobacter cavernae]